MKSIALGTINNNRTLSATVASYTERLAAWPFMLLMLSSGLPLNYKLEEARPIGVADSAELTAAAASSANFGNSILFVIFMGGLYCASAWILLRRPRIVGWMVTRQWPVFFLLVFVAMSILWSYNETKVATNVIHNFGTAMIALAAALRYRRDPWLFPKHLSYVLGINMLLHIVAIFLIPSYAVDWQNRWHGLTTHPNTLGAMAFTTVWANVSVLLCQKKSDKVFAHLIFTFLGVIAMIGADSVTSMLTSVFAVLAIIVIKKLKKIGAGQHFYIGAFTLFFIAVLLVILLGPNMNFASIFELFGRDANLTGRTSVWEDAMTAIGEHPLLGWSFDDHSYLITVAGMPYPSYHNGILDLAVCGGLIGVTLFMLVIGIWAIGLTKSSRIAQEIAPFSASFVLAYLLHNMTEASLVTPRGQLWQIFLVIIFLGACNRWTTANHFSNSIASHANEPLLTVRNSTANLQ